MAVALQQVPNPNKPVAAELAMTDRYIVPGLVRGLEVLQLFTPERQYMTLGQLAAAIGVTKSAIFRIAYTLCQLGLLAHDRQTKTYSLGPAVLRLGYGYQAARDIVLVATPHLERLRDRTGWSAHLGVLEGTDVVYLLRVPSRRGSAGIVHIGSRLPAHATSMGRVLLAHQSECRVRASFQEISFVRMGPRTPTSISGVVRRCRRDKTRAVVDQIGEFERKIASIAAPIRRDGGQVVAAINLAAPIADATTAAVALASRTLTQAASAISADLGFIG